MKKFTEIYNEYKPQIEKLNKQFKKLQKHTQDLSYTDLKLHEIAFYVGDNERLLNHFQSFCDVEFEYFEYWLQENNLKLDSDDLENLETEFDNSIYELEEYLQAYCIQVRDIKRAYKWLENYKSNQVENFKDFVANNGF